MKKIGKWIAWLLALTVLFSSMGVLAEDSVVLTARVTNVDEYGTIYLDVTEADLAKAGIKKWDIVEVTVGSKLFEMPVDTTTEYIMLGQSVLYMMEDCSFLLSSMSSFVEETGLAKPAANGSGSLWEWADGGSRPESVSIKLVKAGGFVPQAVPTVGALNVLNMSDSDFENYMLLRLVGFFVLTHDDSPESAAEEKLLIPAEINITTFDTLDSMLLGLSSGQVNMALAGSSVADYICSRNPEYHKYMDIETGYSEGTISDLFYNGMTSNYAFMLPESKAALRDEFNEVLQEMIADGTMQQLVKDYITDAVTDQNTRKVEFEKYDDAETIRFVVTGDIPPVDYVAEDGTPAGFSTAVLAEIGRRMHRNIQLVVSTNLSRSLELSSGNADVAFWTRTQNELANIIQGISASNLDDLVETAMDRKILDMISYAVPRSTIHSIQFSDVPDGMITTDVYYSEPVAMISLSKAE